MTSKISQFKKQIPINIKYLNRNKSFHFNNNNKNNRIISNNFYLNTKNNTYHLSNNQRNELNANKGRSFNGTKLRNNSMDKTDMKNNKSNRQKNMKYNKFLLANKNNRNNINLKNKTHELISNGNKIKNLTNQNILYNHYKKLVQSPRSNRNEMLNHGIGSKYNLFKLSNLSNENINDINKRHNKKEISLDKNGKEASLKKIKALYTWKNNTEKLKLRENNAIKTLVKLKRNQERQQKNKEQQTFLKS